MVSGMYLPTEDTNAYDHIRTLRVVRAYTEVPLADEDLDAILDAARWTGSSKNIQGWEFIVVSGDQLSLVASAGDFTDPVRNSTTTICLVRTPDGNDFDIGRAAQNIMLAAAARGVGSCPITFHHTGRIVEVLGLPDGHSCRWGVALGYPFVEGERRLREARRAGGMGGRKPIPELVHWQVYGGERAV
jgi:nitroreductase